MRLFTEYVNEVIKLGAKKPRGYVDMTAAFVLIWNKSGTKKRQGSVHRAGGTSVYTELVSFANSVHITEISIPNRDQGSGAGHIVMKKMTKMADKFKVKLDLFPSPIIQGPDEKRIPKDKLVKFYKKHGFVGTGQKMIRDPK